MLQAPVVCVDTTLGNVSTNGICGAIGHPLDERAAVEIAVASIALLIFKCLGAAAKAETAVARTGPAVLAEAVAEGRRALCSEGALCLCSLRANRQTEQSGWLPV